MTNSRLLAPGSQRRFTAAMSTGHGLVLPAYHPAMRAARTIFPSRVYAPDEIDRLLKDGHQSRKIGKIIAKGHRRGWPIFTLTLEERATCPRTCSEWASCYGNRMQAAERIEHGDDLMVGLAREITMLAAQHTGGFLVRLHVLGDFWSPTYVSFWRDQLRAVPALHVFGFTAHGPASDIGRALSELISNIGWKRAAIRFSGAPGRDLGARVLGPGETDTDAILCPAQTGATDCCATCALCWQSQRSISFKRH